MFSTSTRSPARGILAFGIALTVSLCGGQARPATNIIQSGTFQNPIEIGTPTALGIWSDWTGAGIGRDPAPSPIPGDYATLPVGADLFQRFAALANATYTLTFLVEDASAWAAQLVFAVQEALGSPVGEEAALGLPEDITLEPSSTFEQVSLTFTVDNPPYPLNELTFSNSYDNPIPPIANSVNPSGTIIDIADVSLVLDPAGGVDGLSIVGGSVVPELSTWAMMLLGFAGLALAGYRRAKAGRATLASPPIEATRPRRSDHHANAPER
jgi:hypothetical protein